MSASLSESMCEGSTLVRDALLPEREEASDVSVAGAFVGLDDFSIGSELAEARRGLLEAGGRLSREKLDPALAQLTEAMLGFLEKQVCRIAVIGQIKAGKSTFVNALAQRPDILPVDVNPWTAVITRLNFGAPEGRQSGASFHFFSAEEWRRLSCGGGRLRELAGRLDREAPLNDLRGDFDDLERRAVGRLGAGFSTLLGKHHLFSAITPEVVERYVAAGPNPGAGTPEPGHDRHTTGQFSDITKTAELFFDLQPFGQPSVVIDTPGANDPFLVRDEITLQHLGAADIYVVVLTAQQPFSAADLNLLRTLRGLRQERVIVLINRIDGLADIASESRDISAYVREMLRREFPGRDIPVVAGSAWWGRYALSLEDASDPLDTSPLTPEFFAYARACGAVSESDERAWAEGLAPRRAMAQALYTASGTPKVAGMVSDLMLGSAAACNVARTAEALALVSSGAKVLLKRELEARAALLCHIEAGVAPSDDQMAEALAALERIRGASEKLRCVLDDAEFRFRTVTRGGVDTLGAALRDALVRATAEEMQSYRAVAHRGGPMKGWRCDALRIRQQMAAAFIRVFDDASRTIATIRDEVAAELNAALSDGGFGVGFGPRLGAHYAPSLAPLSQTVALDLTRQAYTAWWDPGRTLEDNVRGVEELVMSEFQPAIRDLVDLVDENLKEEVGHVMRAFRAMAASVVKSLVQYEARLVSAYERLRAEGVETLTPRLQRMKDEYAAQCERLARVETIDRRLKELARRCESFGRERGEVCASK
jgi:signal recognition particle receptor subunit beta